MHSVLVVDDDEAVGQVLTGLLAQAGYEAATVKSGEAALVHLGRRPVDLLLSDVRMPGMDGLALLRAVKASQPELPVVLISAHGTVALAVEAMKAGAADFLLKPFERDEVRFVVEKALASSRAQREAPPARTRVESSQASEADALLGGSPRLDEARQLARRAARSLATVLIRGESGTGKELVARAIHQQSPRAGAPFVKLNCGALPETLFESELFGYEKGAFTGAAGRKPGRVELAQGGTLFLDEVGELSPAVQVKLLRVVQEKEFERLGGTATLKADVRWVAATHRPLEEMVRQGSFRQDLFYRLNVVPISLPPLRERPEDVVTLTAHFVEALAREHGRPGLSITPGALELLSRQAWPGNVRQLQNFIERLVVLSSADVLDVAEVAREFQRDGLLDSGSTAAAAPLEQAAPGALGLRREGAERAAVEEALRKSQGNRSLAARLLGISRRTLYYKLDALGLGQA